VNSTTEHDATAGPEFVWFRGFEGENSTRQRQDKEEEVAPNGANIFGWLRQRGQRDERRGALALAEGGNEDKDKTREALCFLRKRQLVHTGAATPCPLSASDPHRQPVWNHSVSAKAHGRF